jgi:type VI protein secretion system component VasF
MFEHIRQKKKKQKKQKKVALPPATTKKLAGTDNQEVPVWRQVPLGVLFCVSVTLCV